MAHRWLTLFGRWAHRWIVRWAIVQTKNKEKFRYIQFNEILGQILFFSLFITRAKS